jgi:ADP-ribose pyrophosphatase YjhB (NUDIX family)
MAIFVVDDGVLKVLLVKRADHPFKGRWALPGGFADLEKDGSIEDTALRKLTEKTGVKLPYLEQVKTVGNARRDPRGWAITILYFALIDFEAVSEAQDRSEWASLENAYARDLAFDHAQLLASAAERLRSKTRYAALPLNLMPAEFTLTELQQMFEIVLGAPLEKKAFRRRLDASDLLEETGEKRATGKRPAALYRTSDKLTDDFVFPGLLDARAAKPM